MRKGVLYLKLIITFFLLINNHYFVLRKKWSRLFECYYRSFLELPATPT